jgi:ornithine cyclodeaminase/alanine dehydrogenase-like protein (mu-crystallin family)
MKLLVLSAPDVHELLGYDQCADAMRVALVALASGRASDDEITAFESLGLAVADLAAAMAVYQAAASRDAGQWVEF